MPAALRIRLAPPSHPTRYAPAASGRQTGRRRRRRRPPRNPSPHARAGRHRQLADPAGHDPLDLALPQRHPIVVAGRESTVNRGGSRQTPRPASPGPRRGTDRRSPAGRAPRWSASGARRATQPGELLVDPPLDDDNVDPRQRQFARQRRPGWTASGDDHRMVGHRLPAGIDGSPTNGIGSPLFRSACAKNPWNLPAWSTTRREPRRRGWVPCSWSTSTPWVRVKRQS